MIEVTLAIGVTAIGVVGVMAVLPYALKTTQYTSRETYLSTAANLIFAAVDQAVQEAEANNALKTLMSDDDTLNRKVMDVLKEISNTLESKSKDGFQIRISGNGSKGTLKMYNCGGKNIADSDIADVSLDYQIEVQDIKDILAFEVNADMAGDDVIENGWGEQKSVKGTPLLAPYTVLESEDKNSGKAFRNPLEKWKRIYVSFDTGQGDANKKYFVKEFCYTD